jgi:hypothetical protein
MTDPTLLRRAIESVGIEKPSDYTLVLEELERLMDERLVEKVAHAIRDKCAELDQRDDVLDADAMLFSKEYAVSAIEATGISALIRAATDLVKEAEEMGFGKTSETALPGSWDALIVALEEVKR